MRRCTQCEAPLTDENRSWRSGWCKGCEAARVRGYLDRQRAELGDEEFKRRKAADARNFRARHRRSP